MKHTCGSELRIDTLPHNALQAHARAHESDAHEGERVSPCGGAARICHTALMTLPY